MTLLICIPSQSKSELLPFLQGRGKEINEAISNTGGFGIPVICYHEITSDEFADNKKNPYILGITKFKKQMEWLEKSGYKTITLEDFSAFLSDRKKFSQTEKPILITFDDGKKSFIKYAYPILKKAGFKAVLFVFPNATGAKSFLSWENLTTLNKEGHEIESHSYTHPLLNQLADKGQMQEMQNTQSSIKKKLNREIKWLAYPYGAYNNETIRILKETRHMGAFTVFSGDNLPGQNIYFLNRYLIRYEDSMEDFQKYVTKKSLRVKSAFPEQGSRIKNNDEIKIQISEKFKIENLTVESGPNFMVKNKERKFTYDEKTDTISLKAVNARGAYLIVNIHAKENNGTIRHASLLYLWAR